MGSLRPASGPGMRWQGDCVMLGQLVSAVNGRGQRATSWVDVNWLHARNRILLRLPWSPHFLPDPTRWPVQAETPPPRLQPRPDRRRRIE